jgi:hypothetical protein
MRYNDAAVAMVTTPSQLATAVPRNRNEQCTPETIHTWQAALTLYRGDFLEGFYVRDAPDFEQWVPV